MTPSSSAGCRNRLTDAHSGAPSSELNTSIMLDNDEFILDPYPRELTQNPLKKIWMPFKNGHISQRRGKMQPAGQQRGAAAMSRLSLSRCFSQRGRSGAPSALEDLDVKFNFRFYALSSIKKKKRERERLCWYFISVPV